MVAGEPQLTGRISDVRSQEKGACAFLSLEGQFLRVISDTAFPLRAVVKVEEGNRMWMGEVWSCEPTPEGFVVGVEARVGLDDVASVAELASRFRPGSAQPRVGAKLDPEGNTE